MVSLRSDTQAGSPQLHTEIPAHVLHHLSQNALNVRVFLDVGDQQIVGATLDLGQFVGGGPNPLPKGGVDLILNARLSQFGEQGGKSHRLPVWACDGEDVVEAGGAACGSTHGKGRRPWCPKAWSGDRRVDDLVEGRGDVKPRRRIF